MSIIGDDADDDDDMMCPDLADTIERCGGIRCIRRPTDDETCVQCIESCTGKCTYRNHQCIALSHATVLDDDEEPLCRRVSDCANGERCVVTDLGNSSCLNGRYTYMYS